MKKVIFIIGTGHCGSTLLDLLLGSHSEMVSLGEVYKVLNFENEVPVCNICGENCELWTPELRDRLIKYYNPSISQRVLAKLFSKQKKEFLFYSKIFQDTGKDILVDSSKNAGWILRNGKVLVENGIKPILIYLSRDGRAVVNSYFRKYPERGLDNIAENWNARVKKINQVYSKWDFGSKLSVKYKNLAQQPVEVVKAIVDLIEVNYEPEMMRFWEHKHHLVSGNAGTKSMLVKFHKENEHKDWIKLNSKGYYKNHELGIRFDERWKTELSKTQIKSIEKIIHSLNKEII
ncbi:hypothetical protein SAMN04488096_101346 [Mesonia phycicola]|uniref:Sulfotransferase family protein n=1 Tax=Mesonia phycicola TaxID=579105 RepID=A0A1M6AND3_9FLAO|nr:sulfotransferase [Mesonia phycicola]SHI37703.1 hypothetical protein SAMN04488096_101346 [Mesonia phycicola]